MPAARLGARVGQRHQVAAQVVAHPARPTPSNAPAPPPAAHPPAYPRAAAPQAFYLPWEELPRWAQLHLAEHGKARILALVGARGNGQAASRRTAAAGVAAGVGPAPAPLWRAPGSTQQRPNGSSPHQQLVPCFQHLSSLSPVHLSLFAPCQPPTQPYPARTCARARPSTPRPDGRGVRLEARAEGGAAGAPRRRAGRVCVRGAARGPARGGPQPGARVVARRRAAPRCETGHRCPPAARRNGPCRVRGAVGRGCSIPTSAVPAVRAGAACLLRLLAVH